MIRVLRCQKKFSSLSPLLLFAVLTLAIPASAEWKEKVLYSFQGVGQRGAIPVGGVVFDSRGNLYVATTDGGPGACAPIGNECGTVYQLSPPATRRRSLDRRL